MLITQKLQKLKRKIHEFLKKFTAFSIVCNYKVMRFVTNALLTILDFDVVLIKRDLVLKIFRNKFSYLNHFIITSRYKFLKW